MRLVSYNVLADAYLKPSYFPRSPPDLLQRGARSGALAARIGEFDADVVCLQEAWPELVAGLRAALPRYQTIEWAGKGKGRHDGCATLLREAPSQVRAMHYSDGTGHLALVVVSSFGGRPIAIVNTHVRWATAETPVDEHVGIGQVRELLARREELAADVDGWVVCGDLNAGPSSEVIETLRRAGFQDAYEEQPDAFTCNSSGVPKRIDFVLASRGLVATGRPLAPIESETALPSHDEPSDHLPLVVDLQWG